MGPHKYTMTDISRNSESKVNIWMKNNSNYEKRHPAKSGEVLVCIRYVPPQQKLTVNLIEIRNLACGNIQPIKIYIEIRLFDGDTCFATQKTTVKNAISAPFFGETFVFNVPLNKTKNLNVLLTVRKWNRFNSSKKLMETSLLSSQSESSSSYCTPIHFIFEKPGSTLQHWCTFMKTTDAYNSDYLKM